MPRRTRVFYAYPNNPPDLGETILASIDRLKADSALKRQNVRFTPWKDNIVSGKQLISTITGQIDRHQVFACDLTYPNPNVSFELGYAIGRFKRIYVSLNPNITESDRNYRRIYFSLLAMGYAEYDNHEKLADSFSQEKPWNSLDQSLLDKRYRQQKARLEHPTLMYVKPPLNSDSVISTQEEFKKSIFANSLIVDDPREYSAQTLDWYVEKLLSADAVVVHLLSTEHIEHTTHNIKASIIAGLSLGLGRRIAMLAHAPYQPPLDYQGFLKVHDTSQSCVSSTKAWLNDVSVDLSHRRSRRPRDGQTVTRRLDLRSLFLGDPVAEHEAQDLHEYFVETSFFYRALDGPLTILVGRRGSGKTAILYAINGEMRSKKGNHVTILKPIGYETHGLLRVIQRIRQRSERGFLIESLWKFLIYSEIAKSVSEEIQDRPVYQPHSLQESEFLAYIEENAVVLKPPFSERIENAVNSLENVGDIEDAGEQRLKISESLHSSLIRELRRHLGNMLTDLDSLTLLIDGLDEPWGPGEHIVPLSELIGGLLGVAHHIPNDFRRSSSRVKPVATKVAILLRSDIFAHIQHLIPEQDKLPIVRVTWSDHGLLLRVLEERMLHGAPNTQTAEDIWKKLFPAEVVGVTSQQFILRTVLSRPRDLIHLMKSAVNIAINRGQEKVSQDDFLAAREQYSEYAFNSILKEDDPEKGKLEAILYEFAGAGAELRKSEIEGRFALAGVKRDDVEFYLDLLCDINFLGIQTKTDFRFPENEENRRTLRNIAKVLASSNGIDEKFAINPAFFQVLQIE